MSITGKIIYSAPASVILTGEHGIIYGKPALGTAINMRVICSVFQSYTNTNDKRMNQIARVVKEYLTKTKIDYTDKHFYHIIQSSIPSCTAFHVLSAELTAVVGALVHFFTGRAYQIDMINIIVYEVEKKLQDHPFGLTNTISCMGGLVYFRREFEFLKGIYHLFIKIPQKIEESLFLIDTGNPEETESEMMMIAGELYKKKLSMSETIFNEMEKYAKRMTIAFMKEDASFFQDTIAKSQKLLEMLEVVSVRTKKIIADISPYAVSKIIGFGGLKKGSGLILCYVNDKKNFRLYLKKNKYTFYKLQQSLQGVRKEVS